MADIKVRVGQQNAVKVVSSIAGSQSLALGSLNDVNASALKNGMVLVYNSTTGKWDATLELTPGATQNLDINGGSF
jgi:phage-related minor tail protein